MNRRTLSEILDALKASMRWSNTASREEAEPIDQQITDVGYYEAVSQHYISAQVICIMLLSVFLFVSLLTRAEELSIDNLVYFIKDMNTSFTLQEQNVEDTFVYTTDPENQFQIYRDGLAILGENKITVFTATGRESFSEALQYQNPVICSSGPYVLTFDHGGTEYRLYNSFTRVYSQHAGAAIRNASVCDAGLYALVCDGSTAASEIVLYNKRFQILNRYTLSEYTVCAPIREDGQEIALVSVTTQESRMTTAVLLCVPGESTIKQQWTLPDAYPVDATYTDDGHLLLLTTAGLFCYDADGELLSSYPVAADAVHMFHLNSDGCVLLCRANNYNENTKILAFDNKVNCKYNVEVPYMAQDAAFDGSALYVLHQQGIDVLGKETTTPSTQIPLAQTYDRLLITEDGEAFACGRSKAVRLYLNDHS